MCVCIYVAEWDQCILEFMMVMALGEKISVLVLMDLELLPDGSRSKEFKPEV